MRILGHRGASLEAPENTLEAFGLALAQGADGVELDVRLCASGEVVVFHDETLERLVGRPGRVAQTPWSTLRALEVVSPGGRARIPLLAEVLEALPRTAWVNVEMKADSGWHQLAARVARLLLDGQHQSHVVVSSFHPLCLLALAAYGPSLRRGYLLEPDRPAWVAFGPLALWAGRDAVHPANADITQEGVRAWHARGREVAVWTVDEVARAQTLAGWGVDSLITNRPGLVRRALG